jgi:hypothetical protein
MFADALELATGASYTGDNGSLATILELNDDRIQAVCWDPDRRKNFVRFYSRPEFVEWFTPPAFILMDHFRMCASCAEDRRIAESDGSTFCGPSHCRESLQSKWRESVLSDPGSRSKTSSFV